MLVTARDHKKATTNPFSPLEGSVEEVRTCTQETSQASLLYTALA